MKQVDLFNKAPITSPRSISKVRGTDVRVKQKKSDTVGSDSWYNPHNGRTAKISIYENELNIRFNNWKTDKIGPPKRKQNDITYFSRKSRIRVLHKFNRLQTKNLSTPIFVTCTARTESLSKEDLEYSFLKLFLPKIQTIIPELVYSWRLEFHKSGFPHYHCFFWSKDKKRKLTSEYYRRKIRKAWRAAIDQTDRSAELYSCKIVKVNNRRKAFSYVSKYMAKEDRPEDRTKTGRRWATSKNFPDSPIAEINCSKREAVKLLEVVKNLMKEKGIDEEKIDSYLNEYGENFAWLELEAILNLLNQAKFSFLSRQIEFYKNTGKTTPNTEFFDQYSEYMG